MGSLSRVGANALETNGERIKSAGDEKKEERKGRKKKKRNKKKNEILAASASRTGAPTCGGVYVRGKRNGSRWERRARERERERGIRIAPATVYGAAFALKIHPEYPLSFIKRQEAATAESRPSREPETRYGDCVSLTGFFSGRVYPDGSSTL